MKIINKKVLITGGAGFIGSAMVRRLLKENNNYIFNIDKLGYSSSLSSSGDLEAYRKRYFFFKEDLKNKLKINQLVNEIDPDLIIHFAAESHVDRSLDNPQEFIDSNVVGTFNILESTREHFKNLSLERKRSFKFHHVSTDEVFGSLNANGKFNEMTRYSPRSPYSASKAASDHLVNAWHHSYELPTTISNCSNNYGPFQFPEKLIPLSILKSLEGKKIPLYGDGMNIRDWLYVDDHIDAIMLILEKGAIGQTYCIGGFGEITNKDILEKLCAIMDKYCKKNFLHSELIEYVKDRPGHDRRYSINSNRIQKELGWMPKTSIEQGLEKTILWYIENQDWCEEVMKRSNYRGARLGN